MENHWQKKSKCLAINDNDCNMTDPVGFGPRVKWRLLLSLFLLMLAVSCRTDRSLAWQFVSQTPQVHVLIVPPEDLIRSFFPQHPDEIPADSLVEWQLEDSQLLYQVEDSLFLDFFMQALLEELREFEVQVYSLQEIDAFFEQDSRAHIFRVAQVQLMEYPDTVVDQVMVNSTLHESRLEITTLVVNSWFEYSRLQEPAVPLDVLFSMQHRSDYISGRFRRNWRTGEVTYQYRPYLLTLDDAYDLAYNAAWQSAQYIYDYLLNTYILEQTPAGRRPAEYFTYDRFTGQVLPANGNHFISLSPGENENQE